MALFAVKSFAQRKSKNEKIPKLDFDEFMALAVRIFHFVGFEFRERISRAYKILGYTIWINFMIVLIHQLDFVINTDNSNKRAESVSYINYFLVALGKVCGILYYRKELLQSLDDFKQSYPRIAQIRYYKLEGYLKTYKRIESFLYNMSRITAATYNFQPLFLSIYEWLTIGEFTYRMSLYIRFPFERVPWLYPIYFVGVSYSSYTVAFITLSCDLYLFSCILQLSMNLEMLAAQILELQPECEESLEQLKEIAERHEALRKLMSNINRIFVPSILFSLMSSSFILCFNAYLLLEEVKLSVVLKIILLIVYELKQVVITCYIGNVLITSSEQIFDALYMHNWTVGSIAYRKQLRFMMLHALKPFVLNVGGIADVSLNTLQLVLSSSYKMFAVLKST